MWHRQSIWLHLIKTTKKKIHNRTRYKYEVLYCHVITNNHHSSCHSVPNTHSYTRHIRTPSSLLRQTNRHHSTALRDSNISIRVHTCSSKAALLQNTACTVCFQWQVRLWLSAAMFMFMFMFIKGSDGGLEAFETLWHGCRIVGFCVSVVLKEGKKVACAVPISLCSIRKRLPIWASLRARWMVVDCSRCLVSRCAWRSLFLKRPVGSEQLTQQVFGDKRGHLSHPSAPHSHIQTPPPHRCP